MMADVLSATARLIDDKVKFVASAGNNPEVMFDYIPPVGTGDGYMPLEMILASLAVCSGSTVAALLRRMRKDVSALTVKAQGTKREQHPVSFQTITLEFNLVSGDAADADLEKAIALSEQTYCPVWAMLKGNVEITAQRSVSKPAP